MQNRLVRLLLIVAVGGIVIFGFKALSGASAKSILKPVGEKIEDVGEGILGAAVKVLPNPPVFEAEEGSSDDSVFLDEDGNEVEPIEEPVKNIEKQTEAIIEQIKNLPSDQIEAIKKQIYKEMCEVLEGGE